MTTDTLALTANAIFGALRADDPDPDPTRLPAVSAVRKFGMYGRSQAVATAEEYRAALPEHLAEALNYQPHRLSTGRWAVTRRVLPADGDQGVSLHLPYSHTFRLSGGDVVTETAMDGWAAGRTAAAHVEEVFAFLAWRPQTRSPFSWDGEGDPPDLLAVVREHPERHETAPGFVFAVRVMEDGVRLLGAVRVPA